MCRNLFVSAALLAAVLLLSSCGRNATPGGEHPVEAVSALNTHLVNNDLTAFTRTALPPDLHVQLGKAWQAGRTRWPLDELPLSAQYPNALAALSAEDAHAGLMKVFDRQLASAERDLREAARLMTDFTVQFIQHQDTRLGESERAHYSQLVMAAGHWASTAPLADRERARQALDVLIPAARETNLTSEAAFSQAGMDKALRRIAPVMAAFKQVLVLYGLDFDALLNQAQLQQISHTGDQAEVELRYRLGGREITAVIPVEQIEGRWYVRDFVRHVREMVNVPEDNREAADTIAAYQQPAHQDGHHGL